MTGRTLRPVLGLSLAAYFYFCFWNYALAVDLVPGYFGGHYPHGLLDSPVLFGYFLFHSSLGTSPNFLLGQLGTLSLLMAAVCLALAFPLPPMLGFKVFLSSLCVMIITWVTVLSVWLPSTWDLHFADWTTSAGLDWISNALIGGLAIVVLIPTVGWEVWKRASERLDMWSRRKLPPLPPLPSYAKKLLSGEED